MVELSNASTLTAVIWLEKVSFSKIVQVIMIILNMRLISTIFGNTAQTICVISGVDRISSGEEHLVGYCYCGLCSGHCGLVAGKFDELGIGKLLTGLSQKSRMRIVTAGHAVKTTVPPGLGVVNQPLYSEEMPRMSSSCPIFSCRRRLHRELS
jgi:Domain of unknown function (DUF4277)